LNAFEFSFLYSSVSFILFNFSTAPTMFCSPDGFSKPDCIEEFGDSTKKGVYSPSNTWKAFAWSALNLEASTSILSGMSSP